MMSEFIRPADLAEALRCRRELEGSRYIAGGSWVNYGGRRSSIPRLISLEGLLPTGIERDGERLQVGALARLQDLYESPLAPQTLREAAGAIYSRTVRSMATVGGNLTASPEASALVVLLDVLGAELIFTDGGSEPVEMEGNEESERIIKSVAIPLARPGRLKSFRLSAASPPLFHLAAALLGEGEEKQLKFAAAVPGAGKTHAYFPYPEGELLSAGQVVDQLTAELRLPDTRRTSAAYLRHLLTVYVEESLQALTGGRV